VRTRNCSNPEPAHGGSVCNGENTDTQDCVIAPNCPSKFTLCVFRKEHVSCFVAAFIFVDGHQSLLSLAF